MGMYGRIMNGCTNTCLRYPQGELQRRQNAAELSFLHQGITFTMYNDVRGTERVFPYDILPRILPSQEWQQIARGLEQRIRALNLFLGDIYHQGKIFRDKIVPIDLVFSCKHYRREMRNVQVPHGGIHYGCRY
jgi:uncharacterized circularly permuted ATP-grasp superfamily protein